MSEMVCDGCGRRGVSAEHIAARIARLEWATRYRPIHIQTLYVAEAPSAKLENDFYSPLAAEAGRDGGALLNGLGIPTAASPDDDGDDGRLAEFQRRGFYVAYLVECPLAGAAGEHTLQSGSAEMCECFAPGLVKRIRFSYRPKQIVVLAPVARALVAALEAAGMDATLLPDAGVVR